MANSAYRPDIHLALLLRMEAYIAWTSNTPPPCAEPSPLWGPPAGGPPLGSAPPLRRGCYLVGMAATLAGANGRSSL